MLSCLNLLVLQFEMHERLFQEGNPKTLMFVSDTSWHAEKKKSDCMQVQVQFHIRPKNDKNNEWDLLSAVTIGSGSGGTKFELK